MGKLLDNLRKKHAVAQSKPSRHTVNFLSHKDEITEALRQGWTSKQIWEQMTEDSMTTMSYPSLCRLIKKHIIPFMDVVPVSNPLDSASPSPAPKVEKSQVNQSAKKSNQPEKTLTEKERLDLMKEEAFASVRSRKQVGPAIGKAKSREEERRELFGE